MPLVSAYDYLVETLNWLPTLVGVWLFMIVFEVLTSPSDRIVSLAGRRYLHFIGAVSVLGSIIGFFLSPPWEAVWPYSIAAIYLWSLVLPRLAARVVPADMPALIVIMSFVPIAFVIAFVFGVREAYQNLKNDTQLMLLRIEKSEISVAPLRLLEKGVLVRVPSSNKIEFHQWKDIGLISSVATVNASSRGCQLFGIGCIAIRSK